MVELYVLNKNFDEICTVTDFDSMIWTRRYYEPGEFELHVPDSLFDRLGPAAYVCRQDNDETALVEHIGLDPEKPGKMFISGRMCEALLSRFVIEKQTTFSGTPDAVFGQMVNGFAVPKFPGLTVTPSSASMGNTMSLQCTGDNVMDQGYALAKAVEATVCVVYDYTADTLVTCMRRGLDRTESQTVNTLAVFSTDEGSADNIAYDRDIADYKNYAYVAGQDSAENRVIVELDFRANTSEEIREVWIDARDLQADADTTDAEYKELLTERGHEKMAEYGVIETVEAVEGEYNALSYREDFNLGDRCTLRDERTGLELEDRLTEVVETFEKNGITLDLVFGDEKPTITKRIIKEVV